MTSGTMDAAVLFDGSFDGFLSVVHAVYYKKICPITIQTEEKAQLTLCHEPLFIDSDKEQAAKVFSAVRKKISYEAAGYVFDAFLSFEEERFMHILGYIRLGFKVGSMVDSHLREECVRTVHRLAKHVRRETHLLLGFCRFAETKSGVFYCPITPKNDVLHYIVGHFTSRLAGSQWVIHDKSHGQAAIYDGKEFIITSVPKDAEVEYADGEAETQELWITFFNNLAIRARHNKKLQRQLLPMYFRGNMTEFLK